MTRTLQAPVAARSETATMRVAVVDSRRLIADALASLVAGGDRISVVAVAGGSPTAEGIAAARPDVVLLGVAVDPEQALALLDPLHLRAPRAQVALVADALTPRLVGCVLQRGLGGLLLTSCPARDLIASIGHIGRGRAVLPTGWREHMAGGDRDPVQTLSERQLEVLRLLADGCSYEEIGSRLFISANTVKFHMRSIFDRLGVHNRVAAVRMLAESAVDIA